MATDLVLVIPVLQVECCRSRWLSARSVPCLVVLTSVDVMAGKFGRGLSTWCNSCSGRWRVYRCWIKPWCNAPVCQVGVVGYLSLVTLVPLNNRMSVMMRRGRLALDVVYSLPQWS